MKRFKQWIAKLVAEAIAAQRLEVVIDEHIEKKLKEVELKLRPIFETADKEPPAHWKAEAEDVKYEHELRHPRKRR
jgi:hypothetical protein